MSTRSLYFRGFIADGSGVITLESVSKIYPHSAAPAVASVDLVVEPNSILVLLGESGCGKTTTLKLINRLIEPTSGRITIDGRDARAIEPMTLRRSIGYAFQGIGLFPHMTVGENVAVVPRLLHWPGREVDARVDELLELVGLPPAEYRHRLPRALSGGQRQRIGVARALAARAKVLLMDEPFGALDPITRDELQAELKRLQQSLELTVVLVTHDITEALLLADKIAVMKDGRILGHDTPAALLAEPPHEYVRRLMEMPKRQAGRVAQLGALAR
jgi:osmoprotectant transport system ATP-binding protein